MTPYPGESLGLLDAVEIIGGTQDGTLAGDVTYRGAQFTDSAPSRTITPGATWKLFADGYSPNIDDPGIDAVYSWVVEVLSGSGTLTLAEVLDPSYGDYDVAVTHSLGSHTVTGPTTLVVPAESFTVLNGWNGDGAFVLQVQSSGAVEVQQVKLRLWPPGGAIGGWSDQPGFDTEPAMPGIRGAFVGREGVSVTDSPPEAAWDAAMAALVAVGGGTDGAGPHPLTPGFGIVGGHPTAQPEVLPQVTITASLDTLSANVDAAPNGAMAALAAPDPADESPINPDLVDGVDFIRPPEEVQGDSQHYAQWSGARDLVWENATATVVVTGSTNPLEGPTVTATYPGADPVVADEIADDIAEGGALATAGTTDTITPISLTPAGRWILTSVSHSMTTTPPPWPGYAPFAGDLLMQCNWTVHFGTGTPGVDFQSIRTHVAMPPYQVWNPDVVVEVIRKVRQFHRDDGLGVTPPRAFGGASRIRTGRAYGYD